MMQGGFEALFGGPMRRIEARVPEILPPIGSSSASASASASALSLMSWNLLAPPYVRKNPESDAAWQVRARLQVASVAEAAPDIVGLQEFWCAESRFVSLWREFAEKEG
jgi:mRNA deadenylase 3'-5' endonuclease subunit Ccr4